MLEPMAPWSGVKHSTTEPLHSPDIWMGFIIYFNNMANQIYPSELHLNKANASDTEACFVFGTGLVHF